MASSPSDFNEVDEFDEYNPHPYQGGYDIAAAYGTPLRPSSAICYPISSSLPSPAVESPPLRGEGRLGPAEPGVKESGLENRPDVPSYAGESGGRNGPVAEDSWWGYGVEEFRGPQSGHRPGGAEPYQEQFGDWLFSAREFQGSHGGSVSHDQDLWSCAADYFFGYLHSYGEKRDESHHYGNLNYAYNRHHAQEPLLIQLSSHESSSCEVSTHHEGHWEEVCPQSGYGGDSSELPDFEIACFESSQSDDYTSVYPESECSYAHERNYYEQPLRIQQEHVEHISDQNPSFFGFFESHVASQTADMCIDGNKSYEQPPVFIEFFESHTPSQPEDMQAYGNKCYEQPSDEVDFIEKSWCRLLNYNQPGECDESWNKGDNWSYFSFHKYSDYDD